MSEAKLSSAAGSASFAKLCANLINEGGHHCLYPEIKRFRSTDWIAEIWTREPNDASRVKLAGSQGATMEEACKACVADYHQRLQVQARKEELLKDPKVREALALFKSEPPTRETASERAGE